MTIVSIDLTDRSSTAASLAQLDAGTRERLLLAVREAVSGDNDTAILATVRETIAERFPWVDQTGARRPRTEGAALQALPVGVVFATMEFDNGYFLTENAEVVFEDGRVEDCYFSDIEQLLTDEFGARGDNFTLAVDLRTGDLDGDDYPPDSIHRRFGMIPPPCAWTVSVLIREVRANLAFGHRDHQAVSVAFFTRDSHGRLDHRDALITYADGSTSMHSFGTVSTYLMDAYGDSPSERTLLIDLRTDTAVTVHGATSQSPTWPQLELLREVSDVLARPAGDRWAVGVLFSSDACGHLRSDDARVVHADGTTTTLDFPTVGAALLERFAPGAPGRVLLVDRRTNAVVESNRPIDLDRQFGLPTR